MGHASTQGVFEQIFEALSGEPNTEYAMVEATIIPVHRHGHGAKEGSKIKSPLNRRADGQLKSLI